MEYGLRLYVVVALVKGVVLILVVMEYGLRPYTPKKGEVGTVLILVVMEYGLRPKMTINKDTSLHKAVS